MHPDPESGIEGLLKGDSSALVPIGDISEARIGHTFREGVTPDPEGGLPVLQSKDLAESIASDGAGLVRALVPRFDPWLVTTEGDLVFLPRGTRFPALAVMGDLVGALVAAPLYLIRPDRSQADAAYLAALINTPALQAALKAEAKGSYIPQVPAEAIRALRLPLPPLPEQRAIAALAELSREEARIAAALAAHRSVWLHALAVHRDGKGSKRNSRRHANAPG